MESVYHRQERHYPPQQPHGFDEVDKFLRNTRAASDIPSSSGHAVPVLERPTRGARGYSSRDEPSYGYQQPATPMQRLPQQLLHQQHSIPYMDQRDIAAPPSRDYLYDNVHERQFTPPVREPDYSNSRRRSPPKSLPTSPDRGRPEPTPPPPQQQQQPQFSRNDKKRKSTLGKFRSFLKKYLRINNNAAASPRPPQSTFYGNSKQFSVSTNSISGTPSRQRASNEPSLVRVKSFSGSTHRNLSRERERDRRESRDEQRPPPLARKPSIPAAQQQDPSAPMYAQSRMHEVPIVYNGRPSRSQEFPSSQRQEEAPRSRLITAALPPTPSTLHREREALRPQNSDPPPDYPSSNAARQPQQPPPLLPRKTSQATIASRSDTAVARYTPPTKTPCVNGIVNRGNVCYMSASLQCLACTGPFAEYFVCEKFQNALRNRTSDPDASITRALAEVLQSLWFNHKVDDTCVNFFRQVNQMAPQYPVNCQQDAQEFLGWMLNQIHEEIKDVPSTSEQAAANPKWHKKSEEELANDDFMRHTNGNSAIIDLFNAQFRHCVECTHCGFRRLTFDPYMMIQLALRPDVAKRPSPPRSTAATAVFVSHERPRRLLRFGFNGRRTVGGLKDLIYENTGISTDKIVIYQYSIDGRCMTLRETEPLLSTDELTALEVPLLNVEDQRADLLMATVSFAVGSGPGSRRFGYPFVVPLNRQWNYQKLSLSILEGGSFMIPTTSTPGYTDFRILVQDSANTCVPLDPGVTVPLFNENITRSLYGWNDKALKVIVEWKESAVGRYLTPDPEPVTDDLALSRSRPDDLGAYGTEYATVTLESLLQREYDRLEELTDWQCTQCKKSSATSQVKFHSMPPVLVFHLKPFEMLDDRVTTKRVETAIEIPLESLDMTPYVYRSGDTLKRQQRPNGVSARSNGASSQDPLVYDCVGVVHHFGERINSGHYTATTRNPVDGQWRKFDDKVVCLTDKATIRCSASAYLLFYERRPAREHERRNASRWFPSEVPERVMLQFAPKEVPIPITTSHQSNTLPPLTTPFGYDRTRPHQPNGTTAYETNGEADAAWKSSPSRSRSVQNIPYWRTQGTPARDVHVNGHVAHDSRAGGGGYW